MNFHNVQFLSSYGLPQQLPKSEKLEIVFAGRSNVGKSSMVNKIFNRKHLARVSATPGKTITINFFELENVNFVDLPGYGYAKRSHAEKERWSKLVEGYFAGERNLAVLFLLIDIRHSPTKDDLVMLRYLMDIEIPFIIVLTKRDKLSRRQFDERMQALQNEIPEADQITIVPFSSRTGEGVAEIHAIIEELAAKSDEPARPQMADQNS